METEILNSNLVKWKTLPAGEGRRHVEQLLLMEDNDLLNFYNQSIAFWNRERGWEYEKYSKIFSGFSILEIGSGLGYDGMTFSKHAKKWTFCDIIPENIRFIQRISKLLQIKNVEFQILEDVLNHDHGESYDGFYAHGVLHHIPFLMAKKEVENINKYLNPGAKVVLLMYPVERWELCGKPPFEEFGTMTDGEGTPWAEYYDEKKVQDLFVNVFYFFFSH
jgi:SAM-dependent methyltransferase